MSEPEITEDEERLLALLENSHSFPCAFTFKLIYRTEPGVQERLMSTLCEAAAVPTEDVSVKTRASAAGRFVSMTVDLPVQDGLEVLRIYRLIGDQDEVISYF
jgi:putative lipoic acid-binding regulatory protein